MSAHHEKTLVHEHGRLAGHINDELILFQDSAYDLGFKRGVESADKVLPLLYEALEEIASLPYCDSHMAKDIARKSIRAARGEG